MLGYKKVNKKYLKIEKFKENVQIINNNFKNPDIVVVTGIYNNKYKEEREGFRICQNQLPFDSGECEQIRIGIDNIVNDKIIILKEDCELYPNIIKKGIKNNDMFITLGNNKNNPGMVINKNLVYNISFGLKNYFGDIFYCNNITLMDKFVNQTSNINKKMYEAVNYLVDIKPMKILNQE